MIIPSPTAKPARYMLSLLLLLGASLAAAQTHPPMRDPLSASHIILPQTRAIPIRPHLPPVHLEAVAAEVVIRDRTASTSLEITLQNRAQRMQEAVLLLPVPAEAVVSAFGFDGVSSEPNARLLPADEARRIYERIVAQIRDPALLEFAGYALIRSSVFPIPPGGEQKVQLTYEHLLESDGKRIDYFLPRSESLSSDVPWEINVRVEANEPISMLYSPSHEIEIKRRTARRFSAQLAKEDRRQPGPFRLSYLLDVDVLSASVFAYPDPTIGGGYFLLMAGLPATLEAARVDRELTLVIDRSGSMSGTKMEQVRAAAMQIVEGLEAGERFNIIDYANDVASFADQPVVKSRESLLEARDYLDTIRPRGGTNIYDALLEALLPPHAGGTVPIVLFLTDGLPTIGRTRERSIRELVETGNPHRRRVFTFGVGADVNAPLLDRLAEQSGATSTFVLADQDVELTVDRVFQQLYGPVLIDPELHSRNREGRESKRLLREVLPSRLPDLYEGDPLIVVGQYRGEHEIEIELSGQYRGARHQVFYRIDPSEARARDAFVARIWAGKRIAFLTDELRQAGADDPHTQGLILEEPRYRELLEEIIRLSTEFGILTEYTAFLATEGTDLADAPTLLGRGAEEMESRALSQRSGLGAISQSLNLRDMQSSARPQYRNKFYDKKMRKVTAEGVQQIAGRVFYQRDGRWVDSRLLRKNKDLKPDRILRFGTPEHLELVYLLAAQGLQGLLSLPGETLLEVEGKVVLLLNGE